MRKLREEKGVSQAVLSAALGVSKSTVGLWETGDTLPDAKSLRDMADYFDVSVDYMLCRSYIKSIAADIQAAAKYTGLSEFALEKIEQLPQALKTALNFALYSFDLEQVALNLLHVERSAIQLSNSLQGKGRLYDMSLKEGPIAQEERHFNHDEVFKCYSDFKLLRFETIDYFTKELDYLLNYQGLEAQMREGLKQHLHSEESDE